MASRWAQSLPIVTVPQGQHPKRVTSIVPYYQNPTFLETQAAIWRGYPSKLAEHLSIIVVDDGSPEPAQKPHGLPWLRLFRIDEDRPWNWLAARNIGAHHAQDVWLLLTDMDHVVPEATLRSIVFGRHDPSVIYAFSRQEHTGESIPPHSASFLMTRELFWTIGGYDETLSGRYGTDGEWRRRAQKHAPFQVLTDVLVRYEFVSDSSTARYQRKLPADAEAVQRLIAARGRDWTPKTLSFTYHEVVNAVVYA